MSESNCLIWNADFYFIRPTVTLNATTRMIVFHLTTFILKLIDYYTTFFKIFPFVTEYHRFLTAFNWACLLSFKNDIIKKCLSRNSNLTTHNFIWVSRDVLILWLKRYRKLTNQDHFAINLLLVRKQYYLVRLVRTFLILKFLLFCYKIHSKFSKNERNNVFCTNSRILFIGYCV